MIILKKNISRAINKEKEKVKKECEKQEKMKIKALRIKLEKEHAAGLSSIKSSYEETIEEKERELNRLRNILERNYRRYQQVRQREKYLDDLSYEIEGVVEKMIIGVQESIQPFYRTRAKVFTVSKQSDKQHSKVKNLLTINK
ncbi:MAG: hypothetical protein WDA74_07700 [Spirochaetota bacterium]